MTEFQNAIACLPTSVRAVLEKTSSQVQRETQEIRLRVGAPITLSTGKRELLVTSSGETTELWRTSLYVCDQGQITDCFQSLCEYSVHTHQQEICRGYISTRTGCRAGLAGTVVTEEGEIVSMRQITSICLRVARRHTGCADPLLNRLLQGGRIAGALICGEPSSGKTSLLRDMARQLSDGSRGRRYHGGSWARTGDCRNAMCCSTAPRRRGSSRRCAAWRPTWCCSMSWEPRRKPGRLRPPSTRGRR